MQRWRLRFHLQEIDLRPGRTILGRAPECPITFEDALVSRQHAELFLCDEGCLLTDLGSRNGVRVNGMRLTSPVLLSPNDRIRLGRDELVLLIDSGDSLELGSERDTAVERCCTTCGHEHVADLPACPDCGVAPVAAAIPPKGPPSGLRSHIAGARSA
jgi:predicted component of type VI protein secretion system